MIRSKLAQYGEGQLDIIANYEVPGQNEVVSVYVYRLVAGSVPVWFDRARAQIEGRRDVYGTPVRLAAPTPLALPGQSTATGLAATYTVQGQFRSTAIAIVQMGEWMVKIRYSSASLDAAALAERTKSVLTALSWPATIPAPPVAAAEIADCTAPIRFKGQAKPVRQSGEDAMMAALIGGAISAAAAGDDTAREEGPPVLWCRDPDPQWQGNVYRPNNAMDSYLFALGDSGGRSA